MAVVTIVVATAIGIATQQYNTKQCTMTINVNMFFLFFSFQMYILRACIFHTVFYIICLIHKCYIIGALWYTLYKFGGLYQRNINIYTRNQVSGFFFFFFLDTIEKVAPTSYLYSVLHLELLLKPNCVCGYG